MRVGLEKMGLFTPNKYLDMRKLAEARNVDPDKYTIGIGQDAFSVIPNSQDTVTMAANAAASILLDVDKEEIGLVILGTESGIDASKSASIYISRLLGLNPSIRTFEIKEACFGATAGLFAGVDYVKTHPDKKALVIASDIARYGLNTPGEVTQGGGSIAMLLSSNPKIATISDESFAHFEDVMDFWRPTYSEFAFARGKFSNQKYIEFFEKTFDGYLNKTNQEYSDFAALLFHLPYSKMGLKALQAYHKGHDIPDDLYDKWEKIYQESIKYTRKIGNIYTGSLYMGLLSVLENGNELKAGDKLGLFSYGSGAMGEFYDMTLLPDFETAINRNGRARFLANRQEVEVPEYEQIFTSYIPVDQSNYKTDYEVDQSRFVFTGVENNERKYRENK